MTDPNPSQRETDDGVAQGTRTFAGLTLISRFAGLARDLVMVRIFGDTAAGSAFAAAFAVPNLFRRLFGEGALSAAFIPEYAALISHKHADQSAAKPADRFASTVIALLSIVLCALLIVGELALLAVLAFVDDPERAFSIRLVMVMLPFMPLVCIAAALGGLLHVHGRFAPSAGAPILLNACMILAGLWHFGADTSIQTSAYRIGLSAIIAGVLQVGWALWALRGRVEWVAGFGETRRRVRRAMRRFLPALLGLGTLQVNALLDTIIAMWPVWVGPTMLGYSLTLDEASNSVLSFTQRLYQFPLGVFGIAVATAAFPALAKLARDAGGFAKALRGACALSLFIALPASVGLALVREDLTSLMFGTHGGEHGFSEEGLRRSAAVLLAYATAVWAYSLNQVLTRAFYARGDTTTPMRISLAMVAINLTLNLTLIWPLREAGLAWSTAATAIAQTAILSTILKRRSPIGGGLIPIPALVRTVMNTAVMGLTVWLMDLLMPHAQSTIGLALRLMLMTGAGIGVYLTLAVITRSAELRALLARSKAKMKP